MEFENIKVYKIKTMMKIIFLLFLIAFTFSCRHTPGWELVWEENFDGTELDTAVWSRIPRGKPDWQNTQSFDDRCYEMRDGLLILKGIVNDNLETDPSAYLTGEYGLKKSILSIGDESRCVPGCMAQKGHGRLFGCFRMKRKSMDGLRGEKWILWSA